MNAFVEGQRLGQRAPSAAERVVLFWEHRHIPEPARGLGWNAMPEFPNDDFDQLILFRFAAPSAVPEMQRYRQPGLPLSPQEDWIRNGRQVLRFKPLRYDRWNPSL